MPPDTWIVLNTVPRSGSDFEDIDQLKVIELRLLLVLLSQKVGAWVPLRQLRGDSASSSRLSRSLKKLCDQEWISTRKDPDDRREKLIRLTVKGRHRLKPLKQKWGQGSTDGLPITSLQHYLTGISALNVPTDEGTGDWHLYEIFQGSHGRPPGPFFVAGYNTKGTYGQFGAEGIEDVSDKLSRAGIKVEPPVYAANHYRAMVDMLLHRLSEGLPLDSYHADDWFPSPNDKAKLRSYIDGLWPTLNPEQQRKLDAWMKCNDLG